MSRDLRLIAFLLVVVGCGDSPSAPLPLPPPQANAESEDLQAPELTALAFSPSAINTATGPALVTIEYTVTDDLSGVKELCGEFRSPSRVQFRTSCTSFPPATSHSGSFDIAFLQYGEAGTWTLEVFSINDAVGNGSGYTTAQLAGLGFPTELEVTSTQDAAPPVLTALSFAPLAINTTTGAVAVTVDYTVTDDLSGVKELCGQFNSPSGEFRTACTSFPPSNSHSGSFDIGFGQFGESGEWTLELFSINDAIGNGAGYTTSQLADAGFPTVLDVTSVEDDVAPVLTSLDFSPTTINTGSGSANVTISYAVTDDVSGVKELCAQFTSPTHAQFRLACTSFPPALSHNGTFDVFFPQFGETGVWTLEVFSVNDQAGNGSGYSHSDLSALGYPNDLVVTASGGTSELYLHGAGSTANPATLFLDAVAPLDATPKYKDSPAVKFSGGNAWKPVGIWESEPDVLSGTVSALEDMRVWVGLKNSDDVGTRFDVRVEARRNGDLFATAEARCVTGVVRNANQAREVVLTFGSFAPQPFDGASDMLSVSIMTRIGTTESGAFCGGHANAVGLRTYFDAATRPAGLVAVF